MIRISLCQEVNLECKKESTTYNISLPFSKDNVFELSNNVFELSKTMTNRSTRKGSLLFLLFLPHVMNEFGNLKWKDGRKIESIRCFFIDAVDKEWKKFLSV
jgi:hypothetical protein